MSQGTQAVALRCHQVEKIYPRENRPRLWRMLFGKGLTGEVIHALNGISLEVPLGKIVGVLGKNGAGKSTLLRILGGVCPPTRGTVATRGRIAGLFELGGFGNRNLTGREFARRYLSIMGVPRSEARALLGNIRDFSELEGAFDHRIRTYSSGMAARLYFSTATALQFDLYLIDELLSVGDEHFQAKCWSRMRQLLLSGASGVLVTHDWAAVLKLAEQAHVIERGKLAFSGASDEAVIKYLDLPKVMPQLAKFSTKTPDTYLATAGRDAEIVVYVDVLESIAVDFAFSVEMLSIGIGWEIVVLANGIPVADQPGEYAITIKIPALPLAPGTYSLNMFLSGRKNTASEGAVGFESLTWTGGNGLTMLVDGGASAASVRLPFVAYPSASER